MRSNLLLFILFLAGTLTAQNYNQNDLPVQQTQAAVDCYTRNLDNGNAALRRGEAKTALQFFYEAKKCPDAQGNLRRQSELEARIARCEDQLGIRKNTTNDSQKAEQIAVLAPKRTFSNELPAARKNYRANQSFLKDTLDDCFQRMVDEADRAFRLKFWEDAAALYRAAKNCANADQKDRQQMSEKITQCRNAAENELFAKQQEAERQARHAIAANLADDAQELLRTTDRSLAFRLADFANQYVAPDDNPDCVQAMFDAWYYQNTEETKHQTNELHHPIFCYELTNNLGENTQIKFEQQRDGSQWLWAFVPKSGDMFVWEMPTMKLIQAYGTGEGNGYKGFDLSPSDDILFWGDNFFELRHGTNVHRIPVKSVTNWCFSARGDEFFYENVADQKIYALNIREVFTQQTARKGAKMANKVLLPAVPREMVSGVPPGLLAIRFVDGKFWLGYRDRVEVLSKDEPGKSWKREKIAFAEVAVPETVTQNELRLELYPKEGFAVLASTQGAWSIPIVQKLDSTRVIQKTRKFESMFPIAVSPSTRQMACEYTGTFPDLGFWLMDARTGDTLLRQKIPAYNGYDVLKGAFSPDARWVAASSFEGDIKVWALKDAPTVWSSQMAQMPYDLPLFSPNGERLFVTYPDTLAVLNTIKSNQPEYIWNNQPFALRGASDHWALLQVTPDSVEARHLNNQKTLKFYAPNLDGYSWLYSFDSNGERLLAHQTDFNRIEVKSLKTGALVASKVFEGGIIGELQFIPGSDDLLVVLQQSREEFGNASSSVKIWSPLRAKENLRTLRLHDYPVRAFAIDGAGGLAAFSNGSDIRVFDLRNIENEALKIRATKDRNIKSIAFRPQSNQLAAAYSTGRVIFWDYLSGQASLQLQAVPRSVEMESEQILPVIGFSQNGTLLHMAVTDGRLVAYALDPSYIRAVAQAGNRKLQSFEVEHIVELELENALYYPGNFERLAGSDDEPLIRSFFKHFGGQALESNNISHVRDYCERAYFLYERLGGNAKAIWREVTQQMYENYTRKLLLRGSINEAVGVLGFIKAKFNYDPTLLNAHVALLKNDYRGASGLYSQYLLSNENGVPSTYETSWRFELVTKDLVNLQEYELLDSNQLNCFCGTVSKSGLYNSLCPREGNYTSEFLSPLDRTRWEIYERLEIARNSWQFGTKAKVLEEALQKAQSRVNQNAPNGQAWIETVLLEFAKTYREWGVFEQNSPNAFPYFAKAVQLLNEHGALKSLPDSVRLSLICFTQLTWGRQLLKANKTTEAINLFNQGLQTASELYVLVRSIDSTQLTSYNDNLAGPLYEQIGTAFLLEGNTTQARQAFESADIYMTYRLNSLYLANIAIFEGDETQAYLDYGGIFEANQTARALFEIDRLAEKFPDRRDRLLAFKPTLLNALRSKNQRLANAETDYWLAFQKVENFAAQARWDSAIVWSNILLQNAKRCMDLPKSVTNWTNSWLDAHIGMSYYLLLGEWNKPESLEKCIQYVHKAQEILTQLGSDYYYSNREILKTNYAHALLLRNRPGDREKAIELYKEYMVGHIDTRGYDNWESLQKDFRDLKALGAPIPPLPELNKTTNDER